MALNFGRWRNKSDGQPLAEIRIKHYVSRDDLVNALVVIAYESADYDNLYEPNVDDIAPLLTAVSRTKIEHTVVDLYRVRGIAFSEFGVADTVGTELYDTALPIAEQVIARLYPEFN